MIYALISNYPVWIRESMSDTSRIVSILKPGERINVSKIIDDWYEVQKGYVYGKDLNGNNIFTSNIKNMSATPSISSLKSINSKGMKLLSANDDEVNDKTNQIDWFPDKEYKRTITDENGIVTTETFTPLENGTWQRTVVVGAGKQIDTYVYDRDKTLETTYMTQVTNGTMYMTTIYEDGSKKEVSYKNNILGEYEKIITTTDANGTVTTKTESADPRPDADYTNQITRLNVNSVLSRFMGGQLKSADITSMFGIMGSPYQQMGIVDRPGPGILNSSSNEIGRMYADRIMARMPLLIVTPGEPKFLAGWGEEDKSNSFQSIFFGGGSNELDQITKRQGRYYSFESNYKLYMNYVNPMMQLASQFLGVGSEQLPGVYGVLGHGDWSGLQNRDIHSKINYRQSVAYYVNSETQISDNFGNASRKPKVAEDINGYGDMAREVQFLVGAVKGATGLQGNALTPGNDSTQQTQSLQNIEEFTGDILGSNNFLDALAGNVATVMMGGRLMFPEIWTDSSFMRSYNVQFKFRCPNPDPLSWLVDIWAPLAHLLPFAIPKAMGPNGYVAPFIMRAYHSGMFNVQLGLCTSMSITRGDVGDWTIYNLPCSVDVSIEIKDLYDVLNLSSEGDSQYSLMNNIGLLDYISNFCGIDINQPDIQRMASYYGYKISGIPNRLRQNLTNSLDEWATNKAYNMFNR